MHTMIDNLKLAAAVLLLAAGVAGYYLLADSPLLLRLGVLFAGLVGGAVIALVSEQGRQFIVFGREAIAEVKKVVWPSRKETIQTTAAVFAFVVVMALFLWVSDKTLEWVLYDLVLGWRKS
jgi:preprotein translocase subunit SecE